MLALAGAASAAAIRRRPRVRSKRPADPRLPRRPPSQTETTDEPATDRPEAIDEEAIARRALEISQPPDAGTPEENWFRAERELRGN